jgi:hypothetical protein
MQSAAQAGKCVRSRPIALKSGPLSGFHDIDDVAMNAWLCQGIMKNRLLCANGYLVTEAADHSPSICRPMIAIAF